MYMRCGIAGGCMETADAVIDGVEEADELVEVSRMNIRMAHVQRVKGAEILTVETKYDFSTIEEHLSVS